MDLTSGQHHIGPALDFFAQSLREGLPIPLWDPSGAPGLGAPAPVHAPPLPYWLAWAFGSYRLAWGATLCWESMGLWLAGSGLSLRSRLSFPFLYLLLAGSFLRLPTAIDPLTVALLLGSVGILALAALLKPHPWRAPLMAAAMSQGLLTAGPYLGVAMGAAALAMALGAMVFWRPPHILRKSAALAAAAVLALFASSVHWVPIYERAMLGLEEGAIAVSAIGKAPEDENPSPLRLLAGRADITCQWIKTTVLNCDAFSITAARLRLREGSFPGWSITVDQTPQDGLAFNLTPGRHRITAELHPSPVRLASLPFSAIGVVLMVLWAWKRPQETQGP